MWRIMYWILVHLFLSLNIYDLGFSYYTKYSFSNQYELSFKWYCIFLLIYEYFIYNSTETGRVINQVKIPSRMSRITGHCTGYLLISFRHLIFTTSDEMRIFLTLQLVFHVQFLSELPASEIYQNYSTFLKRTSHF